MESKTVRIGWMYPDILNLHGERGSVQAFQRVGAAMGLDVKICRIEQPEQAIPFDELELLIFLPGEIRELIRLKTHLEAQMENLRRFLDRGGHVIAIGTTGLLFAEETVREDGSVFTGLGLLPMRAKERAYVLGDDLHFRIEGVAHEIIGCQIHMANVESRAPLGQTIYGFGNNGTGAEGARAGNLIYTNCLGPVFVKNPWWAQEILCAITGAQPSGREYRLEQSSFESCLRFLREKPAFTAK